MRQIVKPSVTLEVRRLSSFFQGSTQQFVGVANQGFHREQVFSVAHWLIILSQLAQVERMMDSRSAGKSTEAASASQPQQPSARRSSSTAVATEKASPLLRKRAASARKAASVRRIKVKIGSLIG
jgi:hypothetical protein